ncbi:hypothetical protein B5M44_22015 [Shinella sumterensis]|uniref:hypothetical protein n=1 Tax=Shinella sumterensis TaxID=1967501 RepID=UPI00106EEAF3|nr:hypothetical protein [Shinella sumterensis]MCD1266904.1 hypothetical protein [Shinella sumterensis]TFE95214.1 hypothetical protein B5M44_22015 [Shinella sumterensis]
MQSEAVKRAADAILAKVPVGYGMTHDEAAEYASAALTAALSDQERAVEVAIKPLDWHAEPPYHVARMFGNVYAVEAWDGGVTLSGIGGRRDFKTVSEAKAAAQADYEQRIRSALVDVRVEPVAEIVEATTPSAQIICGRDILFYDDMRSLPVGTKLYASPHREGEDSAEVYERCATLAEERAAEVRYASWAVALKRLAQEIRALAATRSASASTAKGCAE